jgi:bacillithiol biosynthesis cysteine-adding enzyme BshC
VVVTGQQVGLFLGPLYTLYKAASAIAVARAIEAESGVRCVPLFWLQTEDHDFAEIAVCTVADAQGRPVTLRLPDEGGDDQHARVAVAHRRLGPPITGQLDLLADALGGQGGAPEVLSLLRDHYRPGASLVEAFTSVLAAAFADQGLLFLDPRHPRLAALAAPLYRKSIDDAQAIDSLFAQRGALLAEAGWKEQVTVRPGCPLVFFHPRGPTGPRYRLQRQGDHWTLSGCPDVVAHDTLLETVAREPLCFSTSALLRPLVQDALLPTAAYVAGPGEINYFAQLGPLYQHFGIAQPLLVPRARFRYLDARTNRLLGQLGLEPAQLSSPWPELVARLPLSRPQGAPDPTLLRHRHRDQIAPLVEEIAQAVAAADPVLERAALRARESVSRALGRLIDRYSRILLERDQITLHRLQRLRAALYPDGVPQERFYGWPWLAARHGAAGLTRLVLDRLEAIGPFDTTAVQELRP